MVFLILAIVSSSLISVLMRFSSNRISSELSMLSANYIVCAFLGVIFADFDVFPYKANSFSVTLFLGIITGALYLISFILLQKNTVKNGIVLSSVFMKLGLLVPMVLSVFLGEMPLPLQIAGFIIAIGAIILINLKNDERKKRSFGLGLIVLLLAGGCADAMSKVYEHIGSIALSSQYLIYTFFTAFLICTFLAMLKKECPGKREMFYGFFIGIPNFFSSKFLLAALNELPAVVVYPTFSVATILIVTLTGTVVFREKLNKLQWFALLLILCALVLLNIS